MLIGDNEGDVILFQGSDEAARYLEGIDVREGRWALYDESGHRLALRVEMDNWGRESVLVGGPSDTLGQEGDLRRLWWSCPDFVDT